MPLRIVFMGTAELACASLTALIESREFDVAGVVTQPDRPKGRALKLQPSPVKETAVAAGLHVWQPERAKSPDFLAELAEAQPDLIVVAAYGQILTQALLDLPKHGAINVHTSLLPKYRGAAPIQWAILNDDPETGVTIMKMAAGLDTGDILSQRATPILSEDNAATLHDRLAKIGAELLVETIVKYTNGAITPVVQDEARSTYARKITKEDGRLDWTLPARVLWNRVRAFTPWPGAFTTLNVNSTPKILKILRASINSTASRAAGEICQTKPVLTVACGEGGLDVEELQLEGGRRITAAQFLAGHPLAVGAKLG